MPRGQVLTIPNGTSVLTTTLSREQKNSIALLNPNDGVLYIKLNGVAGIGPTQWDWKVPSQSYAQLPGPWQSLGAYYNDQSGSGRTAEVNVYESDSQIAIPSFIAIGRAVQMAGSTMDITTGSQPQNPPASTARLWVDGTGNLHILDSTGNDVKAVDTNDALGGVLTGTLLSPQHSTGPHDVPAMLRTTGLGNYNPNSGAGMELFYSGGVAYIQVLDRAGGGSVVKPLNIQACGTVTINPSGLVVINPTSNIQLQPSGSTLIYRPNFQTNVVTNGQHFDTLYVDDWIRPTVNGQGIYNQAAGNGLAIDNAGAGNGLYEYASGRRVALKPVAIGDMGLNPGDIVNQWSWNLAPGGTTASGTDSQMPYGTMTCSGYGGGRAVLIFDMELIFQNSSTNISGTTISLIMNGQDANMRYGFTAANFGNGAQFQVNGIWTTGAGVYSGLGFSFNWHLNSSGQLAINTGIYSKFTMLELRK